jgi:peptidoglycan/xylan/chitin deacetylase (PgdA/CDA1 family)
MLVALGYKKIFWSTDSLDWSLKDADQVLINTLSNTGRGAIILMHSAGGRDQNLDATVAALPDLIYTLRVQGYEFVTVDELLSIPAYR